MPRYNNTAIKQYNLHNGDKRFMFKISLGTDENGKRIVTTRRGFKSYSEADSAYNKLKLAGADGFIKQNQITFDELFELWFNHYSHTVRETTACFTRYRYNEYIQPFFGSKFVDKIRLRDCQVWFDNLSKKITTANQILSLAKKIINYGITLEYLKTNILNKVIKPTNKTKSYHIHDNVYSREELNQFLQYAKNNSFKKYIFFKLLSSTGMRRGEALALQWSDIDFENNTIKIDKTLSHDINNHTIIGQPKTSASIRTIPLSNSLKNDLLKFKTNTKYVLSNFNNSFYNQTTANNWLKQIYKNSPKIKHITVHGFRHTFATLLIEETDVKPKTVQMLLGHEKIQMTLNIYTHVNLKNKDDAINAMNKLNF